ncbi:MAG: htrA 2 [Firmicutes bacterium]|nr:htrA 2 [Bacillota bacterium]
MKQTLKYWMPYIIVAVIGAVIGGGIVLGTGGHFLANPLQKNQAVPPSAVLPPPAQLQMSDARNTATVRAAQTVGPAVVGIVNKAYARDLYNRKVLTEQGSGSGVIVNSSGYIATNYHVVANAQELSVSLADGRTFTGKVVGVDQPTDLAVVKIDAEGLPVAVLGDSDALLVGEPAIAIGNPLGLEFRGSVTVGVISALNRSIDIGERRFKLIQTDAAINPGNSGGALVNADGVVVGINSAKIAVEGVEGIGFAIPTNTARPIIQSIIDKGKVVRPYLGVSIIDQNTAPRYGYVLNIDKGVYVAATAANGPAAKANIRPGDVILKVAGKDANSLADVRTAIDAQAIGDHVEVVLERAGNTITVNVVLEEMPSE